MIKKTFIFLLLFSLNVIHTHPNDNFTACKSITVEITKEHEIKYYFDTYSQYPSQDIEKSFVEDNVTMITATTTENNLDSIFYIIYFKNITKQEFIKNLKSEDNNKILEAYKNNNIVLEEKPTLFLLAQTLYLIEPVIEIISKLSEKEFYELFLNSK